ncbi:MAG: DNRLRE domain-containing protein [Cytophaga sp.]|uniref:DNRLRE domain-containing protein n=1 Tax=Cytophaga sp. TaxID=29535 RepID=UPI003F8036FE
MFKNLFNKIILAAATVSAIQAAAQTTVTFTNGQDSWIRKQNVTSSYETTNFGTQPTFRPYLWTHSGVPTVGRGLLKYPELSQIPSNAVISSATLYIYCDTTSTDMNAHNYNYANDNSIYISRITSSWTETGVTWASKPTSTSTNQVSIAATGYRAKTDYAANVTALVQDMVSNSSFDGFQLALQDESFSNLYRNMTFASVDNATPGLRPKLVVTYTIPAKALHFDGSNDYVQAANYSALNTGNGDFTYEARIKASSTQAYMYPTILSDRNASTENGATIFLVPGTDVWSMGKLWININGTNYPCASCPVLTDDSVHAVAVVRKQDTLKFYVDGTLRQSRTVNSGTGNITATGDVRIGHDLANASNTYFNGDIAEARIWNVARSGTEIAASYNKTIAGNAYGLTGYWRLDEGTGQTAYSSAAGNFNHATLGSSTSSESSDPSWVTSTVGIKRGIGSSFEFPFNAGTIAQGASYSNTQSNVTSNGFDNDLGNASDDIYYAFTISSTSLVTVDHCLSDLSDTYLYLLKSDKQVVTYDDDFGPSCSSYKASISVNLSAGTYYIVSEGYSTNAGNITTRISVSAATGSPVARTAAVDDQNQTYVMPADVTASPAAGAVVSYPNPVKSYLNFGEKVQSYTLYNAAGIQVLSGAQAEGLSTEALKPGIYILKTDNRTEKIVVE